MRCSHGSLTINACVREATTLVQTPGNAPLRFCLDHLGEHIAFIADHHPLVVLERIT